jgi:ATP-dependent protease HslVU (ClpYQ) peptidase subunit
MIANGSGIFGVYAYREILEFDRFWANGTGRAYALGAMYTASQHQQDPVAIARAGLVAGAEFDRSSGGTLRLYRFRAGSRDAAQALPG